MLDLVVVTVPEEVTHYLEAGDGAGARRFGDRAVGVYTSGSRRSATIVLAAAN